MHTVPLWTAIVLLICLVIAAVLALVAIARGARSATQARADRAELAAVMDLLDRAWEVATRQITADPADEPILDKLEIPFRMANLVDQQLDYRHRLVGDLANARRDLDNAQLRADFDRQVIEDYVAGVAALWEIDQGREGGVDIVYLRSIPARWADRQLVLTEAGTLLAAYADWATEAAARLPRAGRTPLLRRQLAALEERRWHMHIDDALPARFDLAAGTKTLPPIEEWQGPASIDEIPDVEITVEPLDGDTVVLTRDELLAGIRAEDVAAGGRQCRVCGCTDNAGCHPQCAWVEPDLCSACTEPDPVAAVVDEIVETVTGKPPLHLVEPIT